MGRTLSTNGSNKTGVHAYDVEPVSREEKTILTKTRVLVAGAGIHSPRRPKNRKELEQILCKA